MLGLALTQNQDLVKKCLEKIMEFKGDISVKCRLGLGLEEDKNIYLAISIYFQTWY